MKASTERCEEGWGHSGNPKRPPAKLCIKQKFYGEVHHRHVCRKHSTRGWDVRPVEECNEARR